MIDLCWQKNAEDGNLQTTIEMAKRELLKGSIEEITEVEEEYHEYSTMFSRDSSAWNILEENWGIGI